MALKGIKTGKWQRQWHLAQAGLRAGVSWAGGQLRTLGLPEAEQAAEREALLQQQADAWVDELGQLKGSIVKVGQILATYADYCLPAPLATALHRLEADTAPLAWRQIQPCLQEAYGERLGELIIEPVPLAAASLSQVHRARCRRDHRVLCLKILYPGILDTLDSDLAVLSTGLRWWMPPRDAGRFAEWLGVIREVLLEELDLVAEAGKLTRWQARLADDPRYRVPAVLPAWSGPTVLAMDFEPGLAPHDPAVLALPAARRQRLAEAMLSLFLHEVLLWGEMQTDPHPGNYRLQLDEDGHDRIVLLDFGSVRAIAPALLGPLRRMIIAAYRDDRDGLLRAVVDAGLLAPDAPADVQEGFTAVLLGLVEPLNYRQRLARDPASVPAYAVTADGLYRWGAARLPKRMGKQALQSAVSRHFVFPGADFILLSRKLAGVYAFIAALDADIDAGALMEAVLARMPAEDGTPVSG